MPDRNKRDAVVAPEKGGGKRPSAPLPKLNLCGDIGLKIGRDGTWYYQGGPIGRKGLVKLFASVLRLEGDGRYYLVTPVEKVPIAVEAMPFVAVEMVREGSGESQDLSFRSNVDDVVTAGPEHPLGFEPGPQELHPVRVGARRLEGAARPPGLLRACGVGDRACRRRRPGRVERRSSSSRFRAGDGGD